MTETRGEVRGKVLVAFRELRKRGYIAKANFLCCQTCASFDIATHVADLPKSTAEKVRGCVFWHKQDEEHFWDNGKLWLAHGPLETSTHGTIGISAEEVAREIVTALQEQGLTVDWDGDTNARICVKVVE